MNSRFIKRDFAGEASFYGDVKRRRKAVRLLFSHQRLTLTSEAKTVISLVRAHTCR